MSEYAQQRDNDRTGGRSNRRGGEAEPARRDREAEAPRPGGENEPDVLLDIPEVSVDSIRLAVDGLDADVSLRARLANLLQLDAGVRVHLEGVELDITGVHAEALLKVRLEKLVQILDRALTTIDRNPQVIQTLSGTATAAMDDVNRATQQMSRLGEQIVGPGEQRPLERVGGATDDLGQQVGAIGAVADQSLREPGGPGRGGKPGPGRGGGPGAGQGGEPGGPGRGGEPGAEQAQRGGGLASGSGGGGEQGQAQRARERAGDEAARREPGRPEEREHGQGAPAQGAQRPGGSQQGGGAEQGGQRPGREEQGAQQPGGERVGGPGGGTAGEGGNRGAGGPGGPEAGQREPSGGPAEGGQGRQPENRGGGGAPSAAQLAEQAGETLRQAGRSVWEAIQDGVAQHRQQRR
ncbi:hypothetical protein DER29_2174 [Micromonospora sp. M71_S20]|uniref:hypothetical protein n=1 Tax=Micromonospora sp. M71_S20 TaxID=592872 RepID=UPI000F1806F1|nr:hypothetical protein [Micromonospora sp. M71_S20]RLK24271.1 hypothetical protein DER29_2174 [Micromonospora sp. M71_S20]